MIALQDDEEPKTFSHAPSDPKQDNGLKLWKKKWSR